ncbi:MAG: hypothetical protein EYC67_02650 [Betaproteobacteria bacterium]|nr:MAG: hypothetical protein EYC67_02650 [Betaproteobacteria bacterium]
MQCSIKWPKLKSSAAFSPPPNAAGSSPGLARVRAFFRAPVPHRGLPSIGAGVEFDAVGNHECDDGRVELLRMQHGGCHPPDANSCLGALVGTPRPVEGAEFALLAKSWMRRARSAMGE